MGEKTTLLSLAASLRSGVALIQPEHEGMDAINRFWLAMEGRARARLPFGERLTLDTFSQALMAEPAPLQVSVDGVSSLVDDRPAVDATGSLLLGIRSSLVPGS